MLSGTGTAPSADRAEQRRGKLDRVQHAQRDALLGLHAERDKRRSRLARALGEPGVTVPTVVVDDRRALAAALRHMAVEQIRRHVVVARERDARRRRREVDRREARHGDASLAC